MSIFSDTIIIFSGCVEQATNLLQTVSELATPPAVLAALKKRPHSLFPDVTGRAVVLDVGATMPPGT